MLRDVATDIGMHESTVSRVVANKYMHTPRGVYELRFFFHSGITSDMGEAISSVTIKDKIRKMIEGEDPARPLSDSRIAELLGARRAAPGPAHGGEVPGGAAHPALEPAAFGRLRLEGGMAAKTSIEYTGRHAEIPESVKRLAARKLQKLEKVLARAPARTWCWRWSAAAARPR